MAIIRYDCITCKIKNCSILKACDTPTLIAISTFKIAKSLNKGEKLFYEGDPVQGIYFIKQGFLKVELNGKQGRPLILHIAGQGAIFGHRTNSFHPYHACTATAVTDIQYCYIPLALFDDIAEKNPVLKQQVINQLLTELELAEKKSVNLAHKTVREKIGEALLILARVYNYEAKRCPFRIHFSRQDIADLTGTTKEQVSKTLNDFEKENLVKCVAKKIIYLDTEALRMISGANH
ncbi:Crp/Fnr family transcriptional regulator [Agriterribacter sp.]|uniref:Crp/Fnr family transcriptional regulator n=1 Tax=Agriterribacter sp. TaxID=2821509 RepID=UPI002B62FE24|nr:Crp/Fnr family transcriptional regulator [Agriterribacter sp.]HTN08326.1 Crp/Fnr family transcriptional regulator [Agriterribacter sp.]